MPAQQLLKGTVRVNGDRGAVFPIGEAGALRMKGRVSKREETASLRTGDEVWYRPQRQRDGRTWAVAVRPADDRHRTLDEGSDSLRTLSGGGGPGTGKRR